MDDGKTGGAGWDADALTPYLCAGVSNGVFYVDGTSKKPTWANSVAASQTFATNPNTGNSDGVVFVNDYPVSRVYGKIGCNVHKRCYVRV